MTVYASTKPIIQLPKITGVLARILDLKLKNSIVIHFMISLVQHQKEKQVSNIIILGFGYGKKTDL